MRGRVGSIEDIARRGWRLRLWCFGCARSRVLDADKVLQLFAKRGWDVTLAAALQRFPCQRCRSWKDVMILPARPPAASPSPEPEIEPELSWERQVARFFHGQRSKRGYRPLPKLALNSIERLKQEGPTHRPAPPKDNIEDLI